jgi:serine phosphatase RsbU (regulator of sigma subunit)
MVVKTEYDRIKGSAADPAGALRDLNERIQRSYPNVELPFTACCFDVKRGGEGDGDAVTVRCATAAHPGLLMIPPSSEGKILEIRGHGSYLGVLPDLDVELVDLEVAPGCRLLAYTDGLLEAQDGAAEALRAVNGDLGQAVEGLLRDVEAFAASQVERADDATAVVIEFSTGGSRLHTGHSAAG